MKTTDTADALEKLVNEVTTTKATSGEVICHGPADSPIVVSRRGGAVAGLEFHQRRYGIELFNLNGSAFVELSTEGNLPGGCVMLVQIPVESITTEKLQRIMNRGLAKSAEIFSNDFFKR